MPNHTAGVIDLADVKRQADERDARAAAAEATRQAQESERRFKSFDRNMQRTFKGIYTRAERHRMIFAAMAREDAA